MKKKIAPLLAFLVLVGISVAVYFSMSELKVQTITGMIGSEKEAFFSDKRVQKILADEYQIKVDFEKVGSRDIATKVGTKGKVDKYDFAFPAGTPAAEKISRDYKVVGKYRVFFTPMAVASWKPVVQVLEKNGIVGKRKDYYGILDMQKLLGLMQSDTRWSDLPNNASFDVGRRVLIKSTDIRRSNSAAMYLSLSSYLANGNNIVKNNAEANTVVPKVGKLFTDQGFLAGSSATPFEDYMIKGMGNSPLVMIYESQFLYKAAQKDGSISDDMVLLYPEPNIYTQHMLMAMTESGDKLGKALTENSELKQLAIEHGYRSNDSSLQAKFTNNIKENGLKDVPTRLNDVVDPPSYEVIEKMINDITLLLKQ